MKLYTFVVRIVIEKDLVTRENILDGSKIKITADWTEKFYLCGNPIESSVKVPFKVWCGCENGISTQKVPLFWCNLPYEDNILTNT